MPANPLDAAAAILPSAEVARAIAVAACKACEALESSSAEPGVWYLDGMAAGAAASISLRISSCISGVDAIVLAVSVGDDCTVCCCWGFASPGRSELKGTTTP